MKYLINSLLISFLYLNSVAFAIGEKQQLTAMEKIGLYTAEENLKQTEYRLRDLFKEYNKRRGSPKRMMKLFPLKDQPFFANQIRLTGIKSFPKMKKIKNHYVVQRGGHTVRVNALMSVKGYILIDGKKYRRDPKKSLEEVFNDIGQLLTRKTSFMSFLLNDAQAAQAKSLVFALVIPSWFGSITSKSVEYSKRTEKKYLIRMREADNMNNAYSRVKDIAEMCEENNGEGINTLIESLNNGVTDKNAVVHHMVNKVEGGLIFSGYERKSLIQEMSKNTASDCDQYAEKISPILAEVIASKENKKVKATYFIHGTVGLKGFSSEPGAKIVSYNIIRKASLILRSHKVGKPDSDGYVRDCEDEIGLLDSDHNIVDKKFEVKEVFKKIKKCMKTSCDELAARHDTCLSELYSRTKKEDRTKRGSIAEGKLKGHKGLEIWHKKINIETRGL